MPGLWQGLTLLPECAARAQVFDRVLCRRQHRGAHLLLFAETGAPRGYRLRQVLLGLGADHGPGDAYAALPDGKRRGRRAGQ